MPKTFKNLVCKDLLCCVLAMWPHKFKLLVNIVVKFINVFNSGLITDSVKIGLIKVRKGKISEFIQYRE